MSQITLSLSAARALMLAAQGLLHPPAHPASKSDVLQTIRRMGALQIDTIHVVARSPYFVLWSRLGDYSSAWLDEHLAEGNLFEYWSHAACLLPLEDYPYSCRMMLEGRREWHYSQIWLQERREMADAILERIRVEGPLRSADFDSPKKHPGGWWNWKDEKRALEFMLIAGDVMVTRRVNFQRLYELRQRLLQRILPGWEDAAAPSLEDTHRAMVLKTIHALGLAQSDWLADYFRLPRKGIPDLLKSLVLERELISIQVEGWEAPFYVHPQQMYLLDQAAAGALQPTLTTLLSPFDPLVWHRKRASDFFSFDYSIECYLPQEKRTYGYFCLPILHRGELVGRLDAKARRQEGIFEIKGLFLEPGCEERAALRDDLHQAISSCAAWHKTPQVVVNGPSPYHF